VTLLQFNEDLVLIDFDAADSTTVIKAMSDRLYARGFVSELYGQQTISREEKHPTGLPTEPFCIAFPHADAEGVNVSSLAVAILRNPVVFKNMADPDEDLLVYIVLLLANKKPEEQIETLRKLAILFGQPEKLSELRSQPTSASAATWLRLELSLSESSESVGEVRKGGLL